MMDAPRKNRRSIRLKGFDYSLPGGYFVTICTHGRAHILGRIVDRKMHLSQAGIIARDSWLNLPARFPTAIPQDFTVMPNHLHAIIVLAHQTPGPKRGAASSAPTKDSPVQPSLAKFIRAFKSVSAIEINRKLGRENQPVWQRNYYEHIIRFPGEYDKIRKYIYENPILWDHDPENI
jgi:REP element-mobilizing transposase RayT